MIDDEICQIEYDDTIYDGLLHDLYDNFESRGLMDDEDEDNA